MVCYLTIIALELHWLLGPGFSAGGGDGHADLQGDGSLVLQSGQAASPQGPEEVTSSLS